MPPGAVLLEYGGSDESKASLLLAHLRQPAGYIPIDVAEDALGQIVARMARSHPGLPVAPVCADFQAPLALPELARSHPCFGFFPGSTIGNMDRAAAVRFLKLARSTLGRDACFLIGVDLRKDPGVLIPAYADASGVTAAFNRNILTRLNREADADFDPAQFEHRAVWNDAEGRIEMHLVSPVAQTRHVAGRAIRFAAGESIHTENSYKHSPESFAALVRQAGWRPDRMVGRSGRPVFPASAQIGAAIVIARVSLLTAGRHAGLLGGDGADPPPRTAAERVRNRSPALRRPCRLAAGNDPARPAPPGTVSPVVPGDTIRDGVLTPPRNVDPGIVAPTPNVGTMPIIRPPVVPNAPAAPATPGGKPAIPPK